VSNDRGQKIKSQGKGCTVLGKWVYNA